MLMRNNYAKALVACVAFTASQWANAQCTVTNATGCVCETAGQTQCDLLPDIQISWFALQNYASGPSEYAQTGTNAGRLRISGSTPNQGFGPLEVRAVNAAGNRRFICGQDTISVYAPSGNTSFTCPNGQVPKQRLYQRVYRKQGNSMTYTERESGVMTYHPGHGHYHVDDWTTMTLRIQQQGVSDPRQWPIVATGGKIGFCLMDLSTCSNSAGHCRTSQLYNQGTTLLNSNFPNYGLGQNYGCSQNFQGISSGKTDIYSESLDGMWINMLPGLCNGDYWIVAEVDPRNDWLESNEGNNWTAIPFTLTQQSPANSGATASIEASGRPVITPGGSVTLTANPGYSYLWSTGATTRSITVNTPGSYTVAVTGPCGTATSPALQVTSISAPAPPVGTGGSTNGPGSVALSATGSNLLWYDVPNGGQSIGSGPSFNTPVISQTTNYWVEARNLAAGSALNVGKPDMSGSGAYNSSKQYMYFDAYEPFVLESFKVFANSYGVRHFVLFDSKGSLIAEKFVELPQGMSVVTVNWNVPVGMQHRITAYDDATDVVRDLWRNDGGVSYPYPIGTMGAITGSSGGAQFYYFLYDWVVRQEEKVATSSRTMVTATVNNAVQLDLRVRLEGPYDQQTGLMRDDLRVAGLIPLNEPYTAMGFSHVNGGGGESTTSQLLATTGSDAPVDWVFVQLRSSTDPTVVLATRSGLLTRSGQVIAATGGPLSFNIASGNYRVAVRHRNHLGCMTNAAVALSSNPVTVDMSLPGTSTWGIEARKNVNGTMVLWTGNARPDNIIRYAGSNNDRDDILLAVGGTIPTAVVQGYLVTDVTMDGAVKYAGSNNDRDPILVNIGGQVPTATRVEQLP